MHSASVFFLKGQDAQAMKKLDSAVVAAPKQFTTYRTAIEVLMSHQRYRQAADYAQFVLESSEEREYLGRPMSTHERVAILRLQAAATYEAGDAWQAALIGEKALALAHGNPGLMNDVGYFYAEAGRALPRALFLTREAVRRAPNQAMFVDSLGWTYYKMGRYEEAESELRRAVAISLREPELRYHLGVLYSKRGKSVRARIELSKALMLRPDHSLAQAELTNLAPGGRSNMHKM